MNNETTKKALYNAWVTACENVEIAQQKQLDAMRTKDRKIIFASCDVLANARCEETKAKLEMNKFEEWEIRKQYGYKNVPESPYYKDWQDEDGNDLDSAAFEKWWRHEPDEDDINNNEDDD
jgi:hypothetical protein